MRSGGGGIRTHGTLASTPVFKTGALNRSATPPGMSSIPHRLLAVPSEGVNRFQGKGLLRAARTNRIKAKLPPSALLRVDLLSERGEVLAKPVESGALALFADVETGAAGEIGRDVARLGAKFLAF